MRSDNPNIKTIRVNYDATNNLIVGTSSDRKTIAENALKNLDASGKVVIITDPYLFNTNAKDPGYETDLMDLLKGLGASQINYCAGRIQDMSLFQRIVTELQKQSCQLTHDPTLTDCHDRFWYCPESNKAVVFGTSLNGLCRRICRVDMLKTEETNELKKELADRGIL